MILSSKSYADMNKREFRSEVEKKLLALDGGYIIDCDRKIYEKLVSLPVFLSARRVFLYNSIGREIDTRRIMDFCASRGVPIALPRTFPGGKMDFCQVSDTSALVSKPPYNIYEPPHSFPSVTPAARDVILVPALCFDAERCRMGHGAGYYDCFLASCPAFSIGLCREALIFEQIPREPHDIPVNCLVSESNVRMQNCPSPSVAALRRDSG